MKLSRLAALFIAGGVALLAPLPAHTAAAQGIVRETSKVDLRPKFKVGQETRFKMDMSSSGNQAPGGAGEGSPIKQTIGATILMKCQDTNPETGSTLEVTYETIKIKLSSALMNIDFDSSKPANPDDPMDAAIRSIVGSKLSVKMDKDGNITSVDGGGGGGLGDQFNSADLMKNMFGPLFTTKKGSGQVSVGEKWTNEDSMEAGAGTVRITTTNTLRSMSGPIANIDIKGAFSVDPSSSGKFRIDNSSMSGEAKWDTEIGMLESMSMRQRLTVEQKQDKQAPMRTTQDMDMHVSRVHGGQTPELHPLKKKPAIDTQDR